MSNISVFRINLSSVQNEKGYLDKCYNAMCIVYQHLSKDDSVLIYVHKDESDSEQGGTAMRVSHTDIPKTFDTMCDEWRKIYKL